MSTAIGLIGLSLVALGFVLLIKPGLMRKMLSQKEERLQGLSVFRIALGAFFVYAAPVTGQPAVIRITGVIVIAAGLFLTSSLTAAGGIVQGFKGLFATRMLTGAGGSAHGPGAYSLLADYFPPDRLPARTCVGVTGLARGARVEIDMIARRPGEGA